MFLLKSWYFVFIVISRCVVANLIILERFKIKRPPKWWMSQYVYNKHNTTCKVLRTVFTHSLFLYQKSHSFDFWYKNNSCVNTVRQHFPRSILYIFHSPKSSVFSRMNGKKCGPLAIVVVHTGTLATYNYLEFDSRKLILKCWEVRPKQTHTLDTTVLRCENPSVFASLRV